MNSESTVLSYNVPYTWKYFVLCVLTLTSRCLAGPSTDATDVTGRAFYDDYTTRTSKETHSGMEEIYDIRNFFIVLVVGVGLIILISSYMCKKGYCEDCTDCASSESTRDEGAVVHPPPVHRVPQPVQRGPAYTNVSYVQATAPSAPSVDAADKPPDYATVVLGDLTHRESPFPKVVEKQSPPHFDSASKIA